MPVVRDRKLDAPAEPKRLPAEPLPKAAPMSAPLPCWSSTNTTMPTAARIWSTRINVNMKFSPCPLALGTYARPPDRYEFVRHQRRPADESPVDVRHREQLRRVRGLHASPVEDRNALAHSCILRADATADERVRLVGLLCRRRPARADRPDRLVGDDPAGQPDHPVALQQRIDLAAQHGVRLAALALIQRLAHAEDRG